MPAARRNARRQLSATVKCEDESPTAHFSPAMLESFRFHPQAKTKSPRTMYANRKHTPEVQRRAVDARDSNGIKDEDIYIDIEHRDERTERPQPKDEEEDELKEEESEESLPPVPDIVAEDSDILIIGSNPGRLSSRKGHHFSHPSNHFYKALHISGLTPRRVAPQDDATLLKQPSPYYSIGLTNLAPRPSRMAEELSTSENADGAVVLIELARRTRPKTGAFIGMGVGRAFVAALRKSGKLAETKGAANDHRIVLRIPKEVPTVTDKILGKDVGLMAVAIGHEMNPEIVSSSHKTSGTGLASIGSTLLFSIPSTSGRVTTHQLKDKAECMARLKVLLDRASGTKWTRRRAGIKKEEDNDDDSDEEQIDFDDDDDEDRFKLFEIRVVQ